MADASNPYSGYPNMPPVSPNFRPQKKSKWWIPFAIIFGVIAVFVILIISVFAFFVSKFDDEESIQSIDKNSVLYLNFNQVQEYTKPELFDFAGVKSGASLYEIMNAIDKAAVDPNIKGIYIKPGIAMTMTKTLEIAEKLKEFKKSGKFVYAWMEVGNEMSYMNALPADSIFMSPEGIVELNGFAISPMFYKGLFKKIGIDFYVEQFEDFKSAGEMFSRTKMSDSARMNYTILVNSRLETFANQVETFRKMPVNKVKSELAIGLYTADTILAHGFVDGLVSETSMKNKIKQRILGNLAKEDDKLNLVTVASYIKNSHDISLKKESSNKTIAIINTVGAITSGKSSGFDDYEIKSGDVVSYLKKAREDKNIAAIVLRIDSPGGSVIASDEIWEEIELTKKVKPVIASMSDVAASGGYYMAMACDKIVAHPNTITGSIGVISMIPNASELLNKLEITMDTIKSSPNANFMNLGLPLSDNDKSKFRTLSQGIYFRFINKVAASRGKTFDQARALAKGRVWLGSEAKERGLVDELGGLEKAIDVAKESIGVKAEKSVSIKSFPEKEDSFNAILKAFKLGKDDEEARASITSNFTNSAAKLLGMNNTMGFQTVWNTLPLEMKSQIMYTLSLVNLGKEEKVLVASPYLFEIK